MKRILWYFLLMAVTLTAFFGNGLSVFAKENETDLNPDQLYAQSAVLMDADSGRVLFEKNGNKALPMASTTKIMTCILALEQGDLESEVEISDYAASMPDVQLNARKGEHYRLKDLLYSLMLESHNDSAVAIAEQIGGSVEGFAEMMNQKAKEIGCKNTCFLTPNGLDGQKEITAQDGSKTTATHSATAEDLALIMSYCIKKSPQREKFLEITRTPSYQFSNTEGTRNFVCSNHNAFLNMMEGALSGKTGFTGKAGYCYVGALERDGRTFVVALLACGWPNNKTYKWSDTKKLMKYGIENYEAKDLSKEPLQQEYLKKIPVLEAKTDALFGAAYVNLLIQDEKEAPVLLMKQDEQIKTQCQVKPILTAPVEMGAEVGKIQYLLDGEVLWERSICTAEAVQKVDYLWFFQMVLQGFLSCFL